MKTQIGALMVIVGGLFILIAVLTLPYVIYISHRYGWLDPRLDWLPAMPYLMFAALVVVRAGFRLMEISERSTEPRSGR